MTAGIGIDQRTDDGRREQRVGERAPARQHVERPRERFVDEIGKLRADGDRDRRPGARRPPEAPARERGVDEIADGEMSPRPHASCYCRRRLTRFEAVRHAPGWSVFNSSLTLPGDMTVALLAHEKFPEDAKTAVSMLRYADEEIVAVLDCDRAGTRVSDHLSDVQDAPIVAGMDDVDDCDELHVGIAPIGGGFDDSWRPDVRAALERGCDVTAGLHYFLNDDEEFAALAAANDCELRDVREPSPDLTVSEGVAVEVD